MANWVKGKIVEVKWWNEKLFSLLVDANIEPYQAGQFTKLSLEIDGKRIARAYSFVNAPHTHRHEFLLTKVEQGQLTLPLALLEQGAPIDIASTASGYFTLDEVPAANTLLMLATGTAIGPFLSILLQGEVWQKYTQVCLVHGVRYQSDLVYQEQIKQFQAVAKFSYLPVVSREHITGAFHGRITELIETKAITKLLPVKLNPQQTQVMICGNPDMVKETSSLLLGLGFSRNRRREPGQITVEQYW